MKRHEAREKVYRIIFQMEFHPEFKEMVPRLTKEEGLRGTQGEYALDTIYGIIRNLEQIDRMISDNLKNWTIGRISKTALAALRLGIYEIMYNDSIPDVTAIDEAVTLAHRYCEDDECTFINGVLNKVYKSKSVKAGV